MTGPYSESWQRYKKLKKQFFIFWLGWLPYGGIIGIITTSVLHLNEKYMIPFLIPWMIAFIWVGLRLARFPCPRCGNAYGRNTNPLSVGFYPMGHFGWGIFAQKCSHCNLPKYAEEDSDIRPAAEIQ